MGPFRTEPSTGVAPCLVTWWGLLTGKPGAREAILGGGAQTQDSYLWRSHGDAGAEGGQQKAQSPLGGPGFLLVGETGFEPATPASRMLVDAI